MIPSPHSQLQRPPSSGPYRKIKFGLVVILLGLALLGAAQFILSVAYWFHWDFTTISFLQPLDCIFPQFCNTISFPHFGFIALVAVLLSALLFGFLFSNQKLTGILAEPGFIPARLPEKAHFIHPFDLSLLATFGLCQAYIITQAVLDQPASPWMWIAGLLALFILCFRLDRGQRAPALPLSSSPTMLNGLYLAAISFSLLFIAAIHSQRWGWVVCFGMAGALAAFTMWRSSWQKWDIPTRLERLLLPGITIGSFLLLNTGLNNWNWSFVGDEYAFYDMAVQIANGGLTEPLLSGAGVYGYHPILSSVWQAVTIWFFGPDSYGWRVSNTLLLAVSVALFYYFLRPILGRTGSMIAVVLYGCAHLMLSVGHLGHNNPQVIFVMAASLAALMWAGRRGSWAGFMLVGVCLGLGFYTFAIARIYSLVIAVWLFIYYFPINFLKRRFNWPNFGVWLTVVGTSLLTALPSLSTRSTWSLLANQTLFSSQLDLSTADRLMRFLLNTFYGFTSFLFNKQNGFWIFGAHADPITGVLVVIGLVMVLLPGAQSWKVRMSLFFGYAVYVIVIAGQQQYDYPNVSRVFSFVPFYAFFAAIGLKALVSSIKAIQFAGSSAQFLNTFLVSSALAVAVLAVPLNVWQSYVLSQQNSDEDSLVYILQTAQMSSDGTGSGPQLFLVGSPKSEYLARKILPIHDIPVERLSFVISRDVGAADNVICKSVDQPAIVMIAADLPNAAYIAGGLQRCWPGSDLRLIKNMLDTRAIYRLINAKALPSIHAVGGYWKEEPVPLAAVQAPARDEAWQVAQPSGLAMNSKGQLAVFERDTNQVLLLDASGHNLKSILYNFIDSSGVAFMPDDSLVVSDASTGLLWFDADGQFRFKSDGGTSPRGLFAASDGTLYVAATGDAAIVQLKNDGEVIRKLRAPQFVQPTSVSVSLAGQIAVGDPVAGKVTINSNDGELISEFPVSVGDTTIDTPGLLWLKDGSLIYTDPNGNRIVWVDAAGRTIKEWQNIPNPTGLVLLSPGRLLVEESRANTFKILDLP